MGSGLPSFTRDCTCPGLLKSRALERPSDHDPAVTVCGDAFQASWWAGRLGGGRRQSASARSYNPADARPAGLCTSAVWATPGSLAATTGMLSVPRGSEMFQFPRCPPHLERCGSRTDTAGLPHSEIVGSKLARSSPTLIAALPRPSSARSAEASTLRSYCLP